MKKFIKIGTKVVTRHGEAKVTGIELCQNGEKYGILICQKWLTFADNETILLV